MVLTHLSVLGVVLAALVSWFFGALWYSPFAFAKPWMKHSGLSKERLQANSQNSMLAGAGAMVVQAIAIGVFLSAFHPSSQIETFEISLAAWTATVLPFLLTQIIYEQKPHQLVLINGGFSLCSLLLAAAVTMAVA